MYIKEAVAHAMARKLREILYEAIRIHGTANFDVNIKTDDSPVSTIDIANQMKVISLIRRYFPRAAIIAEEDDIDSAAEGAETYWIVDPIDGTIPLIAGIRSSSNILVALISHGMPVLGFICSLADATVTYGGTAVGGAFVLDGHRLRKPFVRMSCAYRMWGMDMNHMTAEVPVLMEFYRRLVIAQDIAGFPRNEPCGQSGLDLIHGRTRFCIGAFSRQWDVAATVAILRTQDGTVMRHLDGSEFSWVASRWKLKPYVMTESEAVYRTVMSVYAGVLKAHRDVAKHR